MCVLASRDQLTFLRKSIQKAIQQRFLYMIYLHQEKLEIHDINEFISNIFTQFELIQSITYQNIVTLEVEIEAHSKSIGY